MSDISIERVATDERTLPAFAEVERFLERIRARAYELCAARGFAAGRALDDWLAAEREFNWPAGELVEREQEFALTMTLPGFEAGDISVTAAPREIIVQGRAKRERREESGKGEQTVHWSEISTADVCRRVALAREIDVDKVTASLKSGVLRVLARKVAKPAKPVAVAA